MIRLIDFKTIDSGYVFEHMNKQFHLSKNGLGLSLFSNGEWEVVDEDSLTLRKFSKDEKAAAISQLSICTFKNVIPKYYEHSDNPDLVIISRGLDLELNEVNDKVLTIVQNSLTTKEHFYMKYSELNYFNYNIKTLSFIE